MGDADESGTKNGERAEPGRRLHERALPAHGAPPTPPAPAPAPAPPASGPAPPASGPAPPATHIAPGSE
ncbi:MAG: hypothetical protein EOO73_07410 [Myxococcales bacterium]|nr:MAG: hypothetical protein EOO73_07410 [Myxococcales bacterium]